MSDKTRGKWPRPVDDESLRAMLDRLVDGANDHIERLAKSEEDTKARLTTIRDALRANNLPAAMEETLAALKALEDY